jgi:hypothetical protein
VTFDAEAGDLLGQGVGEAFDGHLGGGVAGGGGERRRGRLAYAILAVIAARERDRPDTDGGLIPLTINEIRHLSAELSTYGDGLRSSAYGNPSKCLSWVRLRCSVVGSGFDTSKTTGLR